MTIVEANLSSILTSSTIGSIRLRRSFSNSLKRVGRRLIGLDLKQI